LACVDGSFNAEAAAKYAINIAQACKAEIHVVCVIEKGVHPNAVAISFERLAQTAEKDNIPFHTHFLYGDVVSQIVHLVKKESIELVLSSVRRADWNYYDPVYQKATTMCLLGIVVTQIANGFVCRSAKESVLKLGFFSNRLLLLGIGCEIVLGIGFVYFPPFQSVLNTRI